MFILFPLAYAVITAFGKTFLRKSFDETPPSVSFALETLFGLLFWSLFAILSKGIIINDIVSILPFVLLSAILSEAYIFYIFSKGKLSIIMPVFSTYSVFTILFSRLINNEYLFPQTLLLIFFIILGVILISLPDKFDRSELKSLKTVAWGLSGAIAIGFSDTISKTSIDSTSAATFLFTLGLIQIPVAIVFLKLERQPLSFVSEIKTNYSKYKYGIYSALCISIGMIFFWLSFENTLASIASPLTSTTSMFTVVFAWLLLREKISRKNLFAIGIIISSTILLTIV